ncbi:MAG: HAD-IIB family hydrolase [Thiotrichales bacterium]|nr:HAD-IIB family hydrolase [Thiotrichales bacterium]
MSQMVIFTDLDGTLLNHHNYDYQGICPLLAKLKEMGIPVILNSSKTLDELARWQELLKLDPPVIAENGGVVLLPSHEGSQKVLIGKPYSEIRSYLKHLRKAHHWDFEGFGDWTVAEVMNKTGLKVKEAALAKEREVTEPIIWKDSPEALEQFEIELEKEDLILKKGGRFYHVMGKHDKADAMQFLVNKEYFSCGSLCKIIALGDSDNDLAMLNYADTAVVLPAASGERLEVAGAIYVEEHAPLGWVKAVESIVGL